jgi:hypothetical protein
MGLPLEILKISPLLPKIKKEHHRSLADTRERPELHLLNACRGPGKETRRRWQHFPLTIPFFNSILKQALENRNNFLTFIFIRQ